MRKIYVVEDDENIREAVLYALKASGFEAVGYAGADAFYEDIFSSAGGSSNGGAGGAGDSVGNVAGGGAGGAGGVGNGACGASLVILDVMLPGDDGLTILKKLRRYPATHALPVIMLTAKGSEFDKVIGFELGADDYITKPFSVIEMISRINAVLRRTDASVSSVSSASSAPSAPSASPQPVPTGESEVDFLNILDNDGLLLDNLKRTVTVDGKQVALTFKEYELLYYMMLNRGLALNRSKIIEEVWGYDFEGESRTLDMHIRTLRQKLGRAGENIITIRNFGYKLR